MIGRMAKARKSLSKGEYYRKRAAGAAKQSRKRGLGNSIRKTLNIKRKALSDMADNEDWLDGTIKPKD
jgi:hypothetical protein